MFGSVLATVKESLTTVRPATQASWIFHRNPVIRLTSVAIAIEPLSLASYGCFGCSFPSMDSAWVVPLLRVVMMIAPQAPLHDLLTRARCHLGLIGPRRPDPAEDPEADQQHEHRARGTGDGDADDAVRARVELQPDRFTDGCSPRRGQLDVDAEPAGAAHLGGNVPRRRAARRDPDVLDRLHTQAGHRAQADPHHDRHRQPVVDPDRD